MYKFVAGFSGVRRISDGAFIPDAPGNRDWQEFREWLAKGNTPLPSDQPSLDEVRKSAFAAVDAAAGRARTHYITSAPGQDGTYLMKAEQAAAYRAAGYPADASPWLLIALEAQATGQTPQEVADLVLATRDAWILKAAEIEAARIGGKRNISAAATVEEVEAALNAAVGKLKTL